MPTETTTASSQCPAPSSPGSQPAGLDITTMVLAAVMAAVIVASGLYGFRDIIARYLGEHMADPTTPARVVYVDTEKLLAVQIAQMTDKYKEEPAKAMFRSRDLINQLDGVLQQYADAGYLVLTKQSVLKGLEGRDVTEPVMVALGLSTQATDAPTVSW